MNNELTYKSLKKYCDPEKLPFETTDELESINTRNWTRKRNKSFRIWTKCRYKRVQFIS